MTPAIDLRDGVAVVTGAGTGLGPAIADELARAGAHVAVLDINADSGRTTAGDLAHQHGVKPLAQEADVANRAAVDATCAGVKRQFERVDIAINSADVSHVGPQHREHLVDPGLFVQPGSPRPLRGQGCSDDDDRGRRRRLDAQRHPCQRGDVWRRADADVGCGRWPAAQSTNRFTSTSSPRRVHLRPSGTAGDVGTRLRAGRHPLFDGRHRRRYGGVRALRGVEGRGHCVHQIDFEGRGVTGALVGAVAHEGELDMSLRAAEWLAVPQVFILAGGIAERTVDLLASLHVGPLRMRANLDLTDGAILAQASMMALAGKVDHERAHTIVMAATRSAVSTGRPLLDVWLEDPRARRLIDTPLLERLRDPRQYLSRPVAVGCSQQSRNPE